MSAHAATILFLRGKVVYFHFWKIASTPKCRVFIPICWPPKGSVFMWCLTTTKNPALAMGHDVQEQSTCQWHGQQFILKISDTFELSKYLLCCNTFCFGIFKEINASVIELQKMLQELEQKKWTGMSPSCSVSLLFSTELECVLQAKCLSAGTDVTTHQCKVIKHLCSGQLIYIYLKYSQSQQGRKVHKLQ